MNVLSVDIFGLNP